MLIQRRSVNSFECSFIRMVDSLYSKGRFRRKLKQYVKYTDGEDSPPLPLCICLFYDPLDRTANLQKRSLLKDTIVE